MIIDKYSLKARYAPALLTIVLPIMIFNHFFISPEFASLVGNVIGAKIVSNLTISSICLYYFSEFGRLVGKNVFENFYYKEESYMPTTNFLMESDPTFTSEYKEVFRTRVLIEFGFDLPSPANQKSDEITARKRIVEVMALIRKKLEKNKFLFQHNIEYGAMRNAVGGATIGIALCFINIGFFYWAFPSTLAIYISSVLFALYVLLLLLSKIIINFFGRNYAKILFREFIAGTNS